LEVEQRLVNRDRQRTAFATCLGSSIPMSSIVRTPMRLFAMPIRTLRFDRPCRLKKNLSASVSAGMSLTSPPATIPRGIGSRATWTSRAEPFTSTAAAERYEAPILRPTVSLDTVD
jgi:hypothetical protein